MTAASRRRGVFVTGTDTGVGKTWVSVALLRALQSAGVRAVGMKPVASGCSLRQGRLVNADALLLQTHGAVALDYAQVNPYAFAPPVSPHIAARLAGTVVRCTAIVAQCDRLCEIADAVVVEGVGGWLAPLTETKHVADLVGRLGLPVVLVVGLRLGCINHALLTARAVAATGSFLVGWVGNVIDPGLDFMAENLETLDSQLGAPCFGVLPNAGGPLDESWLIAAEGVLSVGLRNSGLLQSFGV